jgi:hypothetical protein
MTLTDPRRDYYITRFNLPAYMNTRDKLPSSFLDQLDRCKSNAARRILLGVKREPKREGDNPPPDLSQSAGSL